MANRYAVANGNWSNPATWDGGTLPDVDDIVRPNGFTVTIDQDVEVDSLINNAFSPINSGGWFEITSANITIQANIYTYFIDLVRASSFSGSLTIIGNSYAENSNGSAVLISGQDIVLNYIGNVFSGFINSGFGSTSNSGIRLTAGAFNFIGNATCRGGGYACGIYSSSNNVDNTFVGNAYNNSNILHPSGSGLLVSGSSNTYFDGTAEHLSSLQTIFNSPAILADGFSAIYGEIIAIGSELGFGCGINAGSLANVIIKSSINRGGLGALINIKYSSNSPSITVFDENNSPITLTDPSQTNPPDEKDVRQGVNYAGGAFTGSLIVPNPEDVRKGVEVDDTVGTGIITGEDFFEFINTSPEPLAERLRNVATVQTVGDQFNSFNG